MSSTNKQNLLLLFDRPQEPVFVGKGEKKAVFDIPDNYLVSEFVIIINQLHV